MRLALALCCAAVTSCATAQQPAADSAPAPTVAGPARGTLFIAGGGMLGPELVSRFISLAGGDEARLVIIPTAATEDTFPDVWTGVRMFRDAGVDSITVLHTRSRQRADADDFAEPLSRATAVWIPGGRQWRLADAYLDTRTLAAIHGVLDRGGVVGGTSAGASIMASYMVRGAVESNEIVMAPGSDEGFGLLRSTAIDQHLTARNRQDDMLAVVRQHPDLLGIGIDEGTALIVARDRGEVAGRGRVAFYNTQDHGDLPYYFLSEGNTFDFTRRSVITGTRITPRIVLDEAEVLAAMNRLFDAMRTRDTTSIRALAHPDFRAFIPTDVNGQPVIRTVTLHAFIAQIAASEERLDERPIRPEVRVAGPLASVWTYYDFLIGSSFSHCGHDSFQYARDTTGWVIVSLAYTIRRDGCSR